jgi:hypothetical protein
MAIALCHCHQRLANSELRSAVSGQHSAKQGVGIRLSAFDEKSKDDTNG